LISLNELLSAALQVAFRIVDTEVVKIGNIQRIIAAAAVGIYFTICALPFLFIGRDFEWHIGWTPANYAS
jgi:hypothetical protein